MLDYVRPDLLMLRQLCLGLVMWDYVEPTLAWVYQQVPLALRQATGCEEKKVGLGEGGWPVAAGVAGASKVEHEQRSSKQEVSSSDEDDDDDFAYLRAAAKKKKKSMETTTSLSKVDILGYAQAHANVTTGALMAIGLRFAGTAHGPAHRTLSFHVRRFHVRNFSLFWTILFVVLTDL